MARLSDANDRLYRLSGGKLTLDQLANLLTGGGAAGEPELLFQHKDSRVQGTASTLIAGAMSSLWGSDGTPLAGGAAPGAFANPTNTTVGGLMQANPGGGRSKLMSSSGGTSTVAGLLVIYDRLAHMSGMDSTLLTAQNVNGGVSGDVTRYTNGVGNQLWIEIYTLLGGTSGQFTAAYKDGAGSAQTTPAMPIGNVNLKEAGRIIPVPLVAGGSTIKGCTSVTLSVSTGTAGNFGVTIAHPLIYIPISGVSSGVVMDFLNHPIPEMLPNACLAAAFISAQASACTFDYYLQTVEI